MSLFHWRLKYFLKRKYSLKYFRLVFLVPWPENVNLNISSVSHKQVESDCSKNLMVYCNKWSDPVTVNIHSGYMDLLTQDGTVIPGKEALTVLMHSRMFMFGVRCSARVIFEINVPLSPPEVRKGQWIIERLWLKLWEPDSLSTGKGEWRKKILLWSKLGKHFLCDM